ncbi:hypothetical protein TREMEDRAFT_29293 [Tremella mesenterica DSM 1558]|uniref:uncharacterized protein n=1 Tax=Tremella mesenterica (strain ATCC 24925 / CBS 8224 / DSM 1558 / NBRC 9311 / NRRL Y-6157 / RJB 2259-6 / UBC 559-6) TaxID=578456 RepID=UPI0003F4A18D|nr:uncharacterized protein TREMEDRAFT_29293 [Tremella mesenterica DSM 1558]EIW70341.1 hypothetical protein TREMEDRAFT_29293 [Tremella mesenterica DSM 1558]
MSLDPEAGISVLFPSTHPLRADDEATAWLNLVAKHKTLAELHRDFLQRVFDPLVPSSLQQLATRYNIPSRLWQVGFHMIHERLRHVWQASIMTGSSDTNLDSLDLLTDLVYDAYKFYIELLDDTNLISLRGAWIESLGDLARYRMAIAKHLATENKRSNGKESSLTREKVEEMGNVLENDAGGSIGAAVAENWEVEDEVTWRITAREWYTSGITDKPGEGRLHHHLALLSVGVVGEESRALHHFTKSLIVTHSFSGSRESILPLFDTSSTLKQSETPLMDMFVRLHGMLFTKIQLDDFSSSMSRFLQRLESSPRSGAERISQVDWMVIASVNVASVLQYASVDGIIRQALAQEGVERRRNQSGNTEEGEDTEEPFIDNPNTITTEDVSGDDHLEEDVSKNSNSKIVKEEELSPPLTYAYAIDLTYQILLHTLSYPFIQQGPHSLLSPYLTLLLTFLATLSRQSQTLELILPLIPIYQLSNLLSHCPPDLEIKEESRLIIGPPLPEDWLIRGSEWVGRRVFERGFWKSKGSGRSSQGLVQPRIGERFSSEIDVLVNDFEEGKDESEGVVDDVEGTDLTDGPVAIGQRRWRRVIWAIGVMVKHVDGLELRDGKLEVNDELKEKMGRLSKRQKETLSPSTSLVYSPNVQEDEWDEDERESDLEENDDDPELVLLKDRRGYLESLLESKSNSSIIQTTHQLSSTKLVNLPTKPTRSTRKKNISKLRISPGHTVLIFDTNVLLSSLVSFTSLVQSRKYKCIIPLPVITELDGLAKQPTSLGKSAMEAVEYVEKNVKINGGVKVQTTRGNYLSDLNIRTEQIIRSDHSSDLHDKSESGVGTMDDRVLDVALWQLKHWVKPHSLKIDSSGKDRREEGEGREEEISKVVLITFDRNLRLKAKSRGLEVADEREMSMILNV